MNAGIIKELRLAFLKLGIESIPIFLDDYSRGLLPESELEELLLEWNTGTGEEEMQEMEETCRRPKSVTKYIEICGNYYLAHKISSLEREEKIDYETGDYYYTILMNRSDSHIITHANTVFKFDTVEERDKVFRLINDKLAILGIIKLK